MDFRIIKDGASLRFLFQFSVLYKFKSVLVVSVVLSRRDSKLPQNQTLIPTENGTNGQLSRIEQIKLNVSVKIRTQKFSLVRVQIHDSGVTRFSLPHGYLALNCSSYKILKSKVKRFDKILKPFTTFITFQKHEIITEDRVRFLSFLGVGKDEK